MIREYLAQRKARKVLGKFVAQDALEATLSSDGAERQPFSAAHIEFVLVFVDGHAPEVISERVGKVVAMAMSHGGTVHDIIGALVVIAYGTTHHSSPVTGRRPALVEQLRNELSSHLKIVHGAADGHYGLFGSGVRISHSFMLPGFDAMLGRLSQLEFGQIEEYAPHELPMRKSHS